MQTQSHPAAIAPPVVVGPRLHQPTPPTLGEEFHTAILAHGNKQSTFDAYWPHVLSFIAFTRERRREHVDRNNVTSDDVYRWRDHLAGKLNLSPPSCNQRTRAIRFLFIHVFGREIVEPKDRPLRMRVSKHKRRRLIHRNQIAAVFKQLAFRDRLIAQLMYAGIMRLDDVINLRFKDFDFDNCCIEIAEVKHDHFRRVPFPRQLHASVRRMMASTKTLWQEDVEAGNYGTSIPYAYDRKEKSAPLDLRWYYLFSSGNLSRDPKDGVIKRYHLNKQNIGRNIRNAVKRSATNRVIKPHDFRRSAATHFYQKTKDLLRLQKILGHNTLEETKKYIFADEIDINGDDSPFDDSMMV